MTSSPSASPASELTAEPIEEPTSDEPPIEAESLSVSAETLSLSAASVTALSADGGAGPAGGALASAMRGAMPPAPT